MSNEKLVGSTTDIALIIDGVVVIHEGNAPKEELLGYWDFNMGSDDVVEELTWLYDEPKEVELRDNFLKKYKEYINAEQTK